MKSKVLCIILFYAGVVSCGDFLEPKSASEYVPKDASSLNEVILGEAYPQAKDMIYINNFLGLLDDDISCAPYTDHPNNEFLIPVIQKIYSWQSDMFDYLYDENFPSRRYNLWETSYMKVLGANAVLDYIDDASGSVTDKANVKAQGLALRAFYHFYLVNLYGMPYDYKPDGLGVPLRLSSGIEEKELTRNTVKEVYTCVVQDLLESEKLYLSLPKANQWNKEYRTSLPMVQLFLSRVFLYMENWAEAAIYAQKVVDNGLFRLMDLNSLPAPTSSEPFYNFMTLSCPENIWLYGNIDDVSYLIGQEGYDEIFWEDRCVMSASDELMGCFQDGDLRKTSYVIPERKVEGYRPYGKYKVSYRYSPISGSSFARRFGLAEAYLNLAEAKAMLFKMGGDVADRTGALEALNYLRMFRFIPEFYEEVNIPDAEELIAFVREERRRELCFEDHRWFDLRRYGMPRLVHRWEQDAQVTLEYVLNEKDLGYVLPIPRLALDLNKKLVQNPLAPIR